MRKKTVQNPKKLNSLKIQENISFLNGSLVKGPSFETSIQKPLIFWIQFKTSKNSKFFPSSKFRFF